MGSLFSSAMKLFGAAPKGIVSVEKHGQTYLVDAADTGFARDLLRSGEHERGLTLLFCDLLKPGMVVVDAGANAGWYSLLAGSQVGPSGLVFAFEPEEHNCELLTRNIAQNHHENITPLRLALSDQAGEQTLHLDSRNFGLHSLAAENVNRVAGTQVVEVTTLDLHVRKRGLSRLDLLKADVQGAEGHLLAGARETLRRLQPMLMINFWPAGLDKFGADAQGLLDWLKTLGYEPSLITIDGRIEGPRVTEAALADVMSPGSVRKQLNLLFKPTLAAS